MSKGTVSVVIVTETGNLTEKAFEKIFGIARTSALDDTFRIAGSLV
jgi:hypothetical protein